ncbi:nonstructural protein [Odrenisrou virus]|uniref:Nonstructural protein n=1 Tax=Odrenisrou virus TaxID=1048855 RepID=I1T355_9VIRU|nr:nonstructural protein [Odrenisrou virus]AEL29672.1 nonstructural protein [Odrenisrou virus]
MNAYSYIHDLVVPYYNSPILRDVSVEFRAVNDYLDSPVCVYNSLEFPLHNLSLCTMESENLYDCLDSGLMPWRWGPEMFVSRIVTEETRLFDPFMKQFHLAPLTQILGRGRSGLRSALAWPTGNCSLRFFRQQWGSESMSFNSSRRLQAQLLFQSTQADNLEIAISALAKDVRGMALSMSFPLNLVPCLDICKSVSILQFMRVLRSVPEMEMEREELGLRDDLDIFLGSVRDTLISDFPGLIEVLTPQDYDSGWDSLSSGEDEVEV